MIAMTTGRRDVEATKRGTGSRLPRQTENEPRRMRYYPSERVRVQSKKKRRQCIDLQYDNLDWTLGPYPRRYRSRIKTKSHDQLAY